MIDKAAAKGPSGVSPEQAYEAFITSLGAKASDCLKDLLENKHLYQKTAIPYDEILASERGNVLPAIRQLFDQKVQSTPMNFHLSSGPLYSVERPGARSSTLLIILSNARLFCKRCDRLEPFQPVWWTDAANEARNPRYETPVEIPANQQWFYLMYQCQGCQGIPELILVRRSGWNLFLDGRSPMEGIQVERFLPKPEQQWFRDALIAYNSGKILAGLFYLRTFIEQFARRQTKSAGRATGEEILTAYGQQIPLKQRDSMPSLGEWYEKLSEALHHANEDPALFDAARQEIERHFDIRRVFKIPENL